MKQLVLEVQAPDDYTHDVIGTVPDFQIGGPPQTKEWMVIDAVEEHYPNHTPHLYYDSEGDPCADIYSDNRIIGRISFRDT